eukprot:726276-Pyramimonas_sp.AAC.1
MSRPTRASTAAEGLRTVENMLGCLLPALTLQPARPVTRSPALLAAPIGRPRPFNDCIHAALPREQ